MNTEEIEIAIPQEIVIDDSELTPDALIKRVQRHRLQLLLGGKGDLDPTEILLLNSIASTAVAVKRITTDDNNSAADREISQALVESLSHIKNDPFVSVSGYLHHPNHAPQLPAIDIVPDEITRGLTILEIKDINDA